MEAHEIEKYLKALGTELKQQGIKDCAILLPQTKIKTRRQAQQLLNRYILAEGQAKDAEQIVKSLDYLFGEK